VKNFSAFFALFDKPLSFRGQDSNSASAPERLQGNCARPIRFAPAAVAIAQRRRAQA